MRTWTIFITHTCFIMPPHGCWFLSWGCFAFTWGFFAINRKTETRASSDSLSFLIFPPAARSKVELHNLMKHDEAFWWLPHKLVYFSVVDSSPVFRDVSSFTKKPGSRKVCRTFTTSPERRHTQSTHVNRGMQQTKEIFISQMHLVPCKFASVSLPLCQRVHSRVRDDVWRDIYYRRFMMVGTQKGSSKLFMSQWQPNALHKLLKAAFSSTAQQNIPNQTARRETSKSDLFSCRWPSISTSSPRDTTRRESLSKLMNVLGQQSFMSGDKKQL